MPRAATEVMQSVIYAAVVDAIEALKAASKGVPNTLLRDLQSVHRNTAFEDLPKELQDAIAASVRSAFNQFLKEGYSVAPTQSVTPPRHQPPRNPTGERRPPSGDRRPRSTGPRTKGPEGSGPGKGPGNGPSGNGPRRPRPPKGKPRLS